ncbi:hypothetical protein [Winogradskyella sp.]|jgi:hypothetical protein|uniref:DUF6940 family protein n=1 Tax=Winogradskyella sp. TaxID=1883156 RepID=UPI0025E87722|nr:hypothetical protein [Winogradskyella sp.]MCT4630980.1 hypothetical protein [Winogradskyella sp.]
MNGNIMSFSDWISAMLSSDKIIKQFNQTLVNSSFAAFFWEVKPVNKSLLNQPFEFVIVSSKFLESITANNKPFLKYFKEGGSVVSFPNLRSDAELIVPKPISTQTEYTHIATFVRTAAHNQILDFWKKVVYVYSAKINEDLKWLSTSGLGVHWLHVRIDSRPKYYQYSDYKYFQYQ